MRYILRVYTEEGLAHNPWEIFNITRWSSGWFGISLGDADLQELGDRILSANPEEAARWKRIRETAKAGGQTIAEVCDSLVESSGDWNLISKSARFRKSRLASSVEDTLKITRRVEELRQRREEYVEALETLLLEIEATALYRSDVGPCDTVTAGGRCEQSIFCAAVLDSIRRRKERL